ncbi:MAG: hypothetical protein MI755_06170 [Sphingomonadales bacterium]|nr:hypothetical protein [Sphingomonadales bacterium]
MTNQVTTNRVKELIAAYGGDPARWPDEERTAAEAVLEASPEAQLLLKEAQRIDAALAARPAPVPADGAFVDRLMAIPAEAATATQNNGLLSRLAALMPMGRAIPQAAALGVAFFLGAGIGFAELGQTADPEIFDASAYAFGYTPDEADFEEFGT